jgi:hypothetical protein
MMKMLHWKVGIHDQQQAGAVPATTAKIHHQMSSKQAMGITGNL